MWLALLKSYLPSPDADGREIVLDRVANTFVRLPETASGTQSVGLKSRECLSCSYRALHDRMTIAKRPDHYHRRFSLSDVNTTSAVVRNHAPIHKLPATTQSLLGCFLPQWC